MRLQKVPKQKKSHKVLIDAPNDNNPKPPVPIALQPPLKTYHTIRYNGIIENPPSKKPFQDFLPLFKEYFKIIQEVLGKNVFIASWDQEQERQFPPLKSPSNIPSSRESIGIYLGTYVNPKRDGSNIFLNIRLITFHTNEVPLDQFGMELASSR